MEHLSLEIFDLTGNGSKYAYLSESTSITITDTSEIFASGDVWSYSFKLNIPANVHIFGSAGELHGGRLHEQVNKRRARLWVMGVPLYLGYLKLGDEVEVDEDGDVSVTFESGQKTFRNMIEGMNAREVSVGDVQIGIALNRKRVADVLHCEATVTLDGLAFSGEKTVLNSVDININTKINGVETLRDYTYIQRWPKLVMSKGTLYKYYNQSQRDLDNPYYFDNTNVNSPYSAENPFCNVNICYQKKKQKDDGSEYKVRGYTLRLGHGSDTWTGGDSETRFNNSPNFFLLYWLDRLFIDKGIVVQENQMMNVDALRRVFLANLGCFYEEKDLDIDTAENYEYGSADWERYGKFTFPAAFVRDFGSFFDQYAEDDNNKPELRIDSLTIEGKDIPSGFAQNFSNFYAAEMMPTSSVRGYIAYATGDNYPDVEASEIINSTEAAFGVRFLFDRDFTQVRIVLLRNIFQNNDVQEIICETIKEEKIENSKRGFVLTYGGDEDDTTYTYDDWLRLDTSKSYQEIRDKAITSLNKVCYVTPVNGNAYRIKIDETEKLYYPVLVEVGGYSDAKDGDCDGEEDTIETVTIPAKPLIMNEVDGKYAVFFSGDMKVPGIDNPPMACSIPAVSLDNDYEQTVEYYIYDQEKATAEVNALWKRYYELEEEYERRKAKEKYPHVEAFSFVTKAQMRMLQKEIEEKTAQYQAKSSSTFHIHLKGEFFITEKIAVNLQDNYDFSGNDGTPFDKANIGLCFGMMRGSGPDSFIYYNDDPDEEEGNDYWEMIPGSSVVDHPDTCDGWGNRWSFSDDYVVRRENVPAVFDELFPLRNEGYFYTITQYGVGMFDIPSTDGKTYHVLMRLPVEEWKLQWGARYYISWIHYLYALLWNFSPEEIMEHDRTGLGSYDGLELNWNNLIIELDSSYERLNTLIQLIWFYNGVITNPPVINTKTGVITRYGDFSLKLRAEKPNPKYDQSLPDVVTTKEQAAQAMTSLYTTTNTNLLARPQVSYATIRAAGWEAPGDGYSTIYSLGYAIQTSNGMSHLILWTPIKEDGTVLTQAQLEAYVNGFNGVDANNILSRDTQHLILDIDTTEKRHGILMQLQAIYYAPEGEYAASVDITSLRYQVITDGNLRGRGLADQFYKEYSYWVRNARIVKRTVKIELAQLLSIDKTKRIRIADVTGFIRKVQYSVSNKTGLGLATFEIMYI